MHELYELKKENLIRKTDCEYKSIQVEPFSRKLFGNTKKGSLVALVWKIITLGKVKAYVVYNSNGEMINYTCVISKCYKFPFMRKGDIEIGPCFTWENYRGQGILPSVISSIIDNELKENSSAYAMINAKNAASIKSFKKSGFVPVALMEKDKLGRHIKVESYSSMEDAKNEFFK